jgi:hypothetical protein
MTSRRLLGVPERQAPRSIGPDARRLFAARAVRMFAYGALAVVLGLFL